jgi:hypothetical protein
MAKFPHAQAVHIATRTIIPATPSILVSTTTTTAATDEILEQADITAQYDADISQNVETQWHAPTPTTVVEQPMQMQVDEDKTGEDFDPKLVAESPCPSETDSERHVSEEISSLEIGIETEAETERDEADVFGPAGVAKSQRGSKRRRGKGRSAGESPFPGESPFLLHGHTI